MVKLLVCVVCFSFGGWLVERSSSECEPQEATRRKLSCNVDGWLPGRRWQIDAWFCLVSKRTRERRETTYR